MNSKVIECIHQHPEARAMRQKQLARLVSMFVRCHPEHAKKVSGWIAVDTDALDKWLDSDESLLPRLVGVAKYALFIEQLSEKEGISCRCETEKTHTTNRTNEHGQTIH